MEHAIGNNVIIAGAASPGTDELSQAVEMGADNRASFRCRVLSITSGTSATIALTFQGSNDLGNWSDLTSTSTGNAPDVVTKSFSSPIQWGYVRLKYNVISAASARVALQSIIETSKIGG